MIIGKIKLGETSLHTSNDSYVLQSITAVSTRRPFLSSGLMIGGLTGSFAYGFRDILFPGELIALGAVSFLSVFLGIMIGRLLLVSRDLAGSPIAEAVHGTYRHLNRLRPQIADAVEKAKAKRHE